MADAPAGGSKLSGGEIILLVVLVLGALSVLSGNPIKPVQTTSAPITQTQPVASHCGIVLSRPVHNEHIANGAITLAGTFTPCDGSNIMADTVMAQAVDKTGAPVSNLDRIIMATSTTTAGSFAGNIPITGNPVPGTGYLIVTGPVRADGTSLTARTAITF